MKKLEAGIIKRSVAALLVIALVVGVSALVIHAPTQNENSLALKSIQTDKAMAFYADNRGNGAWFVELVLPETYADNRGNGAWFVELVLPGTAESKAATENLKAVAATLQ